MAVYNVLKIGDPVLKEQAKIVTKFDGRIDGLVANMIETMEQEDGVGLAAPQVGISKRVIIVTDEEEIVPLINPEIIEASGESYEKEGCLSVPGFLGMVRRAAKVQVQAVDLRGQKFIMEAEGLLAIIIQHEIDHLNGILFVDKVEEDLEEIE